MFSTADGMVNGHGDVGVPDMVTISDIDEHVINRNLKIRYSANKIYVSIEIIQQYCFLAPIFKKP